MKHSVLQFCKCVSCVLLLSVPVVSLRAQQVTGNGSTDKVSVANADTTKTAQKRKKQKSVLGKEQQIKEIVVTGERRQASVNSVSEKITSNMIDRSMGKSLASLLEHVSGVSSIQTGTTVAKPVINGMYGNRILIVNNGARQTGQQWGADHAPEIDKNSSARIQVVKGAEAVRYGSEALGGIIILEQKPLPYGETNIGGSVSGLVGANGLRYNAVATIEGSMPFLRDLAWRVQGTYLNSGDARTADYVLNNTGYREQDVSLNLGYRHGPSKHRIVSSIIKRA
mgnify:CR=1 FL=1